MTKRTNGDFVSARIRAVRARVAAAICVASSSGCATRPPPPPPARAIANAQVVFSYDVHATGRDAIELDIIADFARGLPGAFYTDDDAAPFVHDVKFATPGGWVNATGTPERTWNAACGAAGCRIRYTFALSEAAARIDDAETAKATGGIIIAPPSTWLLRPRSPAGGLFRFKVTNDGDARFASGAAPVAGAPNTFEAAASELDTASLAVFGPFHLGTIESGTSRVDVALAPRGLPLAEADAITWIRNAVTGLAHYYRQFPVARTLVIVAPGDHGAAEGVTLGDGGPTVLLRAGPKLTRAAALGDWVATHELIHVTLPSFGRGHAWLSEGIATYVEPVVRARAGLITPAVFWRDLVEGLPQGLPAPGDEGLERTHTWGRTYWGGALFCFLADVRIRDRTHNAHSFDDVLRAVVATGADVESYWPVEHFFEVGDRATGTSILSELYRAMGHAPETVDLATIWSRLGVSTAQEGPRFDEAAPLAAVRRAITSADANN